MQHRLLIPGLAALALACGACSTMTASPEAPRGRTMYASTQDNRLAKFGSENPGSSVTLISVSGMASGEALLGVDFGPRDGKLYGVGNQNHVYTIDVTTGVATQVSASAFDPALSGSSFGVDFNPTVNRIRVHSNTKLNLRLNPDTGLAVDFDLNLPGIQADTSLAYDATDSGAGSDPSIVATAYTNSNATATTTTLFAIDSSRDVLVKLNSPNDGKLTTVGQLGVDTTTDAGFDISGAADGTAFATLTGAAGVSSLYTVNLTSGQATLVGAVGGNVKLTGLAIAP